MNPLFSNIKLYRYTIGLAIVWTFMTGLLLFWDIVQINDKNYSLTISPLDPAQLVVAIIWLLGIVGILFSSNQLKKSIRERENIAYNLMINESNLRKLELHNELILNSAGEGILGMDIEGVLTFVNPAASKLLGYEINEIIGHVGHDLFHHTNSQGQLISRDHCPIYCSIQKANIRTASKMYSGIRTEQVFQLNT